MPLAATVAGDVGGERETGFNSLMEEVLTPSNSSIRLCSIEICSAKDINRISSKRGLMGASHLQAVDFGWARPHCIRSLHNLLNILNMDRTRL